MITFIKNYWDIISGIAAGVLLSFMAEWKLEKIQLVYSVIILILVCVGAVRIIRQATEKKRNNRKHTIVDSMVDGQKSIKAISLAQSPTKEGEKVGNFIILIFTGGVKGMKKFIGKVKTFFSRFKGYLLTGALAILTATEMCGGFINKMFGGSVVINGIEVIPVATLLLTMIVGILSNGYTKEQMEKIKALFSKSTKNELVHAEIKKTIKEKTAEVVKYNKIHAVQENELSNLNSELETLTNTMMAKQEMFAMIPQLATEADVQLATNAVNECQNNIIAKREEIKKTEEAINALTITINALKSQY